MPGNAEWHRAIGGNAQWGDSSSDVPSLPLIWADATNITWDDFETVTWADLEP